jgi:hypothetical protein
MTERNVLKLDIESITDFQKELHETNSTNSEDRIKSRFSCAIDKYSWSTHTKAKMTHIVEDGEVSYIASKKFDVLFKTELHMTTLPIKVKLKYRNKVQICLPHNLGHNICYLGELKVDDDHHQTIDSVWLDMYSQFYMKAGAGMRKQYNRMIGNIPCLENWNTELPGVKLLVPQPFYYSRNTRTALLLLNSSMNTVTHNYKIRNKIQDILRVRWNFGTDEKANWQEVPCKLKYLDIPNRAKEFPIPELWGRYSTVTDEEREWLQKDPKTGEPIKHIIYTEDIIMATSNNPTPLGSKDVIPLQSKAACKALFWVAQDIKALENRNFSNYTTNLEDIKKGWNPCSKVDLKYGGAYRLEKWSHEHFDLSEAWDFFPSAPNEPGYNAYAFGYEMTTLNVDTAIVLEPLNAALYVRLGDTDPFKTIDEDEDDSDDDTVPEEIPESEKSKYLIHVRALVYKKLEISWNGKDKMKYLLHEDATNKKKIPVLVNEF